MILIHVDDQIAMIDNKFATIAKLRWHLTNNGYAMTEEHGIKILMHRLIIGAKAGDTVDHINEDRLDNRLSNLRIISHSHNMRRSSKYKGYIRNPKGRFLASISINGRTKYLGSFDTEEEAREAYLKARYDLIGE